MPSTGPSTDRADHIDGSLIDRPIPPSVTCRLVSAVRDLVLPTTDAGVLAQVIVITLVFALLSWLTRRHAEGRLLVLGLWLTTYGAIGLRALH